MKSLTEILKILREKKSELSSRYPIESLAIFGSYAKDEATDESDVDIVISFNGKIGIAFVDLANELEEILKKKVDLVCRNGIKDQYFDYIKDDLKYV